MGAWDKFVHVCNAAASVVRLIARLTRLIVFTVSSCELVVSYWKIEIEAERAFAGDEYQEMWT